MSQTVDATYDGNVLRPDAILPIAPNTRVRVTVEVLPDLRQAEKSASFFDVARSLNLEGPPDFARHLDRYLYGDLDRPRG